MIVRCSSPESHHLAIHTFPFTPGLTPPLTWEKRSVSRSPEVQGAQVLPGRLNHACAHLTNMFIFQRSQNRTLSPALLQLSNSPLVKECSLAHTFPKCLCCKCTSGRSGQRSCGAIAEQLSPPSPEPWHTWVTAFCIYMQYSTLGRRYFTELSCWGGWCLWTDSAGPHSAWSLEMRR